ncbi:hypothetical protein BN1723_008725 [Verticillium longisporum]|uniref:Calcium channel YVC1-like C-terminal transmembrane domain-containing protein n=1 Tax=Verticillium longisporum TaxID=100787 RepID=A0A0G4KJ85_VERLO|nr:hypothetical protein BN1723_008725 [Verticillium longisporum]
MKPASLSARVIWSSSVVRFLTRRFTDEEEDFEALPVIKFPPNNNGPGCARCHSLLKTKHVWRLEVKVGDLRDELTATGRIECPACRLLWDGAYAVVGLDIYAYQWLQVNERGPDVSMGPLSVTLCPGWYDGTNEPPRVRDGPSKGKVLRVEVQYYTPWDVEARSPWVAVGKGYHIATEGLADSCIELARTWLRDCTAGSGKHTKSGCRASETSPLPKRVIDVENNKLYLPSPNEKDRYVALSHCWGGSTPMGKDFVKFMVLVVIIYLGFLTTFSLIGKEKFPLRHMAMNLTKIFFGSSFVGFEIMRDIDPVFGPPLMILFVTLSSILLMGSLTGMLSNSFSRVITHAREEYLYVYSVYVLEASTSNRLTHFYPPFNLVALVIFRPLRLILPSDNKFRAGRILLLKATHLPIVGAIQLYELIRRRVLPDEFAGFAGPRTSSQITKPHRQIGLGRPSSSQRPGLPSPRHSSARDQTDEREDDGMEGPTPVEMRVSELAERIDRLTALVEALHKPQEQKAAEPDSS